MRGSQWDLACVSAQDIDGDGQVNRSRSPRHGLPEGGGDMFGDLARIVHHRCPLGDGPDEGELVELLKGPLVL